MMHAEYIKRYFILLCWYLVEPSLCEWLLEGVNIVSLLGWSHHWVTTSWSFIRQVRIEWIDDCKFTHVLLTILKHRSL